MRSMTFRRHLAKAELVAIAALGGIAAPSTGTWPSRPEMASPIRIPAFEPPLPHIET